VVGAALNPAAKAAAATGGTRSGFARAIPNAAASSDGMLTGGMTAGTTEAVVVGGPPIITVGSPWMIAAVHTAKSVIRAAGHRFTITVALPVRIGLAS
jgi:hypothetical protein